MYKRILIAVLLACWPVLSVGQGEPSIRLQDLTPAPDTLPPDCRLKPLAPAQSPNRLDTNPWIGTERNAVAAIGARVEGTPTLPDAAPIGAGGGRRYFLQFAEGVEEAYEATYAQSGARDVSVFALKFADPANARRVPFGRTAPTNSAETRVVLGPVVVVVRTNGPEHRCFEAVRDHVQSLAAVPRRDRR